MRGATCDLFFRPSGFHRQGDWFYYNVEGESEFRQLLKREDTVFLLGFSYCHKPFECPSGRFTDQCVADEGNRVCQQCFIGKCLHASPAEKTVPVIIPTVHYIWGQGIGSSPPAPESTGRLFDHRLRANAENVCRLGKYDRHPRNWRAFRWTHLQYHEGI